MISPEQYVFHIFSYPLEAQHPIAKAVNAGIPPRHHIATLISPTDSGAI